MWAVQTKGPGGGKLQSLHFGLLFVFMFSVLVLRGSHPEIGHCRRTFTHTYNRWRGLVDFYPYILHATVVTGVSQSVWPRDAEASCNWNRKLLAANLCGVIKVT